MREHDRLRLRTWFHAYALGFRERGARLAPMHRLKYDHSLRVAEDARLLSEIEGWPAAEIRLAEVAGLLHDVGRFSQYRLYGTFNDRESVNHAELSLSVLRESAALVGLEPAVAGPLTESIRRHNAKSPPRDPPGIGQRLLHLLRDADKLDIIFVIEDAIRGDKLGLYPEITLAVDLDGPVTPEVLAALRTRSHIGYESLRSLADFLLLLHGWAYDFKTAGALRMLRERRLLERLGEFLPPDPAIREATGTVGDYLRAGAVTG